MKTYTLFSWLVICAFGFSAINAQNPTCPSPLVYLIPGGSQNLRVYDPSKALSPANPTTINIVPPTNAGALALLPNINGGTLTPTFYTVINGNYYYWSGVTWINTGHTTGNPAAVNIGGCPSKIFNIAGPPPLKIYTYDGTANGTSLCVVPDGCVADVVTDCDCNFYLFNPLSPNQALLKYNSLGVLQSSTAIYGIPSTIGGGGFAIIGNLVYYAFSDSLYTGLIGGPTISLTAVPNPSTNPVAGGDWAGCPYGLPLIALANPDTVCAGSTVTLSASGAITYSWFPAGSGPSITVTPLSGDNTYTVIGADPSVNCNSSALLNVVGLAAPSISITSKKSEYCKGDAMTFTASGASSYSWNNVPGTPVYTAVASSNGTLHVMGTSSLNSCMGMKSFSYTVKICNGISEDESAGVTGIFPNPAKERIRIEGAGSRDFQIMNASGTYVAQKQLNENNEADISELEPGVYFILFRDSGHIGKFVKE